MKKYVMCCVAALAVSMGNVQEVQADIAKQLDTVVVTATRIAQQNYKLAGNITIISHDQIEASNAQNVPDLLKESLGVAVYDYGTAKSSNVDIRGFGETAPSNVLVLINDRKINSIDISGPDLTRIPIGSIERIEIIRGAGTVLYGDNAVGGVVNIITKQGDGPVTGRFGSSYGSYDSQGADVEVAGSLKNISYFMYSRYDDKRGYRQNSDTLAKDFNARLGYAFSEKISADLNVMWHEDDYGLAGSLSDAQLISLDRRGSSSPDDFASTKDLSINLSLNINPWPEDLYFGDLVADFSYRNRDVYDSFVSFGSDTKRTIDTMGVAAKYIFDRTIFDHEVNFVTGLDYYDHENELLGSNASTTDITISKSELGVYGFLEYEALNSLFVSGGTRYHQADYAFSDRSNALDQKPSPSDWVYMGGAKYEYGQGSTLHFNVQETFRYLATDEWYSSFSGAFNTDLKQQTGMQYEIGVKHNFEDKALVNITPYLIDIDNEIYYDPRSFSNSNYDKTRRAGVEVGGRLDILKFLDVEALDKLEFFTNYTYQKPQFNKGNNKGKDIPLAPRHQVSSGLVLEFFDHFRTSLLARYEGARFQISDIQNAGQPLKPYYVVDSKVAFTTENFEIYGAVNNMFDKLYIQNAVYVGGYGSFYYPSPERNYTFGVNLKF